MEKELEGYFDILDKIDIEKTLSKIEELKSHNDYLGFLRVLYDTYKESRTYDEFWTTLQPGENFKDYLISYINLLGSISGERLATILSDRKRYDDQIESLKKSRPKYDRFLEQFRLHKLEKKVQTLYEVPEIERKVRETNEILEELRTHLRESKEIAENLRGVSAETGAEIFATVFGKEAKGNKKSANRWFYATLGFVALASSFLMYIYCDLMKKLPEASTDPTITFHLFLVKLLIFSFISVLVYQLMKIYKAGMHVYTLNKHRENSLLTFKTFYDATDDPEIKKMILIQATKAVFEAGDTGYISYKEGSQKDSSFLFAEALKLFMRKE
jgi:hypothetical protein